jgi:hypothetical protein
MTLGVIDKAVNDELMKHVLTPGGLASGEIRVYCDKCRQGLHPTEVFAHLQVAAMRALTEGAK